MHLNEETDTVMAKTATTREKRRVEDFVLGEISGDGNGGLLLRDLLTAAAEQGYTEDETRQALREKEREGKVYVDWEWKYHAAAD
jgi:hypothetical protein